MRVVWPGAHASACSGAQTESASERRTLPFGFATLFPTRVLQRDGRHHGACPFPENEQILVIPSRVMAKTSLYQGPSPDSTPRRYDVVVRFELHDTQSLLFQRKTLAVRCERQSQGRIVCGDGASRARIEPSQFIARAVEIDVSLDSAAAVLIWVNLHECTG